mgnify:FL=1
MCFSPEVDLVASVAIGAVAFETIRHNHHIRTLPIALVPAIFAIHTFSSAFVWLGFEGHVSLSVQHWAINVYLAIAFILWPTFVPFTLLCIEPIGWRRNTLGVLFMLGAITSAIYQVAIRDGNGSATELAHYIDFHVGGTPYFTGALYFMTTTISVLLSGQRPLVLWGLVNTAVVLVLVASQNHGLPSLWCFWAACTSAFVLWFIRTLETNQQAGIDWPWLVKEQ